MRSTFWIKRWNIPAGTPIGGAAKFSGGNAGVVVPTGSSVIEMRNCLNADINVSAANCVDAIRMMDYAYPPAKPCSMCFDNQTSLETKCKAMVDCLFTMYPCTSGNCQTNCLNMAGGSSIVAGCANALTAAACM